MWPFGKNRHAPPHASQEAIDALQRGQLELVKARELRHEVGEVHAAATATLSRNNFGLALTAAMTGKAEKR